MSAQPELKVVELPKANPLNIPEQLRQLAKEIEDGTFGTDIHYLGWVLECDDNHIHVGLAGQADHPLLRAYMLFAKGQRVAEAAV